jgi:hypothetical protein
MTHLEIFLHVAPKVILFSFPLCVAFVFLEIYIERRKASNEGRFRDDRRDNDGRSL